MRSDNLSSKGKALESLVKKNGLTSGWGGNSNFRRVDVC